MCLRAVGLEPRVASSPALLGGVCGSAEQGSVGPPAASGIRGTRGGRQEVQRSRSPVTLRFAAHVGVLTAAVLGWEGVAVGASKAVMLTGVV